MDIAVEMRKISKRFGDLQALDEVDFSLNRGEVHALLGENGAGKTTLMNVLSGLYQADSGEIFVEGSAVQINCPRDAIDRNICMVHQHFELIPNFTALENIILGQEGGGIVIDVDAQRAKIEELMSTYGLAVEMDVKVRELAIGIQQKVEILKALYRGASILILDEPTTMLTPQEVDSLFSTITSFARQGLTVILITHKIREVLLISNRITVMRRGKVVSTVSTTRASEQALIELMIGQTYVKDPSKERLPFPGDQQSVVEASGLGIKSEKGIWSARDVSFHVRRGEIVGLVGVAGNGQREVAEALFGLRPVVEGDISVLGKEITKTSIRNRLGMGLSLIPEDRINQGILPNMSLAETLVLGPHHFLFGRSILFNKQKANGLARKAIEKYQIKALDERDPTSLLSGGNIQKVIVARSFLLSELVDSTLLIAFNPARGLDVMSTTSIYEMLIQQRNEGKSILLISEDLDDSLSLCDRVYVMYKGKVVGEFERKTFEPYTIGALMVGGKN
jgi:general nucleoside transport system ATP-binding protein